MTIGIIGMGYVGTALKESFKSCHKIETYDLEDSLSSCDSISTLISKTQIIFLCVPTPMNKNGSCDLSIVEGIISKIDSCVKNESDKVVVVKSTVPPGTTEKLNNTYHKFNIIFNPEFLTEANFIEDFKNQNRIILGGLKTITAKIKQIYIEIFPKAKIIETDSTHAEMVKYFANTFLATKVSFANEMKMICDKLDIDYSKVVEYAAYDNRLGDSHWSVPGPDGKLGFGGSCFPKDINALISIASKLGVDPILLKSVWDTNLKVRPEKDWEKLKGRAISNDKD